MTEKSTYEELEKKVKELEQAKFESNMLKDTMISRGKGVSHEVEPGLNPEIQIPDIDLESIINIQEIQSIMDDFYRLTNMVTAIIDLKGRVIETTGWQDLCTTSDEFLVKLATYISKISLTNIRLEKEIRERKQAEEALRKRDAYLRTLIETIPDLVWLKDPEGVFLSCNPRFERFYGAKEADIVGKTDYDFVDKDLADFFREKDKAAMAGGTPSVNEEEVVYVDDGHNELLETIKTPMYDSEGKLIGVLGIARDITERKLAEESLREVDRIKNEFISTAAHELRTPLTSIMGFSEMLLQDDLTVEQQREYLAIVIDKAETLNGIIDDLLNLSRIEAGVGIALYRKMCDINEVIGCWSDQLRQKDLHHRLECRFSKTPVMIYADRDKVIQVLGNLLFNAIKFSSRTSRIRLGGEIVGGSYQISVEDEGAGMTPDQISRIFDKFYRVDASNTAPGGLGLGLSIVRTIVEAHGGEIHVESTLGQGTRVCFTLPLPAAPVFEA